MLLKKLYDKTVANPSAVEGGLIGGFLAFFPHIIAAAAAADATVLAAKGIGKLAGGIAHGTAAAGKLIAKTGKQMQVKVRDAREEKASERRRLILARQQQERQQEQGEPVDPLDRASAEYLALREKLATLPLPCEERDVLLHAAEVRFARALKGRLDGLG